MRWRHHLLEIAIVAAWATSSVHAAAQSSVDGFAESVPQVLHMPDAQRRAEGGILRPVPVMADLPFEVAVEARRVLVHYRLWGDPDWTSLELRRNGARYEGAIPCLEISTVTGVLKYYIRVHDAEGRVIATGASRADPYLVTIKHDGDLEDLGNRAKCPDPADCPRGLPGCPSEKIVEIACKTDSDCEGASTCSWRGFCEKIKRAKNWFSLAASQDLGVVSTTGACSTYQQENQGYACFRSDGEQYIGNPILTNEPLSGGMGQTRLLVGVDRLMYFDTTIGLRFGWAVAGVGPTPREGTAFVPFSASARVTHWFGPDPFSYAWWRPFAFISAGYSMVDVHASTMVREDPFAVSFQGGNALEQRLDVYKRAGDGFVGAGFGLAFAWQMQRAAFVELSMVSVFPFSAFVVVPTLGVMMGL